MGSNWYGVHYYVVYNTYNILYAPPPPCYNYFIISVGGSSSIMAQQTLGGLSRSMTYQSNGSPRATTCVCTEKLPWYPRGLKADHGFVLLDQPDDGVPVLYSWCLRSLSPAHDKNSLPFPGPLYMSWTNASSYCSPSLVWYVRETHKKVVLSRCCLLINMTNGVCTMSSNKYKYSQELVK
jgi:hypothetical protein